MQGGVNMIYEAKSGNTTLKMSDDNADPNKRDLILYSIGAIHTDGLAEKAMQEKNKKSTA